MSDQIAATYGDDDLVYVDPETREVIGKVEFDDKGNPKSRPYVQKKEEGKKPSWRKQYPYGILRSMKRAFRLQGKQKEEDLELTLEEVLPRMLEDKL
ncbi:MAG: hypothetical protein AAB853_02110 [Patescibacteria group bacterium]